MKKLLVTILLAVFSNVAMAEWTHVYDNDNASFYVDKASIKRKGSNVKMWSMIDKLSPTETISGRYLSVLSLVEYDCEDSTSNFLKNVSYSENMLNGKVIMSQDYDKKNWSNITHGSVKMAIWKVACSKN